MIKKLLFCLSALCIFTFSAQAQDIAGTYQGLLKVSFGDGSEIPDTKITLTKEAGDTYELSIKDFVFAGILIGDLNVGGITATQEAGAYTLSKEGASTGPVVNVNGANVNTNIYFTDASVYEGNLILKLNVKGYSEFSPNEEHLTDVEFDGNKIVTGVRDTEKNSPKVYLSTDFNTLQVSGADSNYTIYNAAGVTVKSGNVENSAISISDLATGIYLVKINNSVSKFIKK